MSISVGKQGLEQFQRMDKLGEGTYGLVYRARDLKHNKIVAIKKIKIQTGGEEGIPATTIREVSLLQHLRHPNIVEMSGVVYNAGDLYLVFEFCKQDLRGYLSNLPKGTFLSTKMVKKFAYFLTEGIHFCHMRRILHRDLKPQNILISHKGELKIADFGLGREHGLPIDTLTHEVVTLWYRPPEILLGKKRYSGSADIWGIGCILAEIATKLPAFTGDSEIDQLFQIYQVMGTPTPEMWPGITSLPDWQEMGPKWKKKDLSKHMDHKLCADGLDLLEKTLIYSPTDRITAKHMLAHPYFDEIREEMKQIYGGGFPHCGSPDYQKQKHQQQYGRALDDLDEFKTEEQEMGFSDQAQRNEDEDDDIDNMPPRWRKHRLFK